MARGSEATPVYGIRIREHRQRLGLSQTALAAALDRLAWERVSTPDCWRTLGVDQPMVSDWERGRHRPDAYYQKLLCALFAVTAYELGFRERLPWESETAGGVELLRSLNATPEQLEIRESSEHDDDSTRLLTSAPGPHVWTSGRTVADIAEFAVDDLNGSTGDDAASIASGVQLTEALRPWAAHPPSLLTFDRSRPLGEEDAERLERVAHDLRHWDDRVRRGVRREIVVGQLFEVADLLRDRHRPAIARRLLRVLAELAEIAASMSYDAGRQAMAQRYFVYALRAAHAARESLFGGCVLGDMARQMLDLRRPEDALELVRLGLDGVGPHAPGRLRAMLRTREAWAYAATGQVQAFHRAVGMAWEAFAEPGDAEPYRVARFDAAELNGVIGARYRDLARHDIRQAGRARERIQDALRLRHPQELRGRIFDLIGLARTDLMLGESEEAAQAVRHALAIMDDARSGRARRRLRDFYRESERLDTSSIREARNAIADRMSPAYLRLQGETVRP